MLWEARYYPKHRVSRGKDHKGKGRRLIAGMLRRGRCGAGCAWKLSGET